jgi:hypothetical protein
MGTTNGCWTPAAPLDLRGVVRAFERSTAATTPDCSLAERADGSALRDKLMAREHTARPRTALGCDEEVSHLAPMAADEEAR